MKGLVGDSGDTGLVGASGEILTVILFFVVGASGETLAVSVLCDVEVKSSLTVST